MINSLKAVVYDLDSTIADTAHRQHLLPKKWTGEREDWVKYCMGCSGDTPLTGTVKRMVMDWPHYQIHICTGRMNEARQLTERWLFENAIPYDFLCMRTIDITEKTSNAQYKINYVQGLINAGTEVVLFYEDTSHIAAKIATVVPVLGINPFYLDGHAGEQVTR